ncbi:hypothetical protein DM02DRAFT_621448 [Periconia macrospinosa]|uniref:Poly [ADP-ribose] polymerase n=1 Tax=Periconia macrospinosa TaxID=97972 RepID=A0A2V1EDK6_9PLEO|nr:hypothetical protein DM02DRAFT_621448 [Periconia macrospinosa]
MTTTIHAPFEIPTDTGLRLPSWSKKAIFSRQTPREQWHESLTTTAGSLRPSDPLFPWTSLRKHTDQYLKRKGKMSPVETEAKLAALIEEHQAKDVAIAACAHVMSPSSLRALLNVELCVAPVSYLGLDTYLQSLVAMNFYSTQVASVIEAQCAKTLLPYAIRGNAAAGTYLEGICTLLQTLEIVNADYLAGFEVIARRAVRDFAMQLEGMRLRCDWVAAYNAVAWMQKMASEGSSNTKGKSVRLTPEMLLDGQFPSWRIWAAWKPELARLMLMQDVETGKRGVLVDHMMLEGPDFFTGTGRCLRDGMVLQYEGVKSIISFKSVLVEVLSCSKEELAEMMDQLGKAFERALQTGEGPLDFFTELTIKRPITKQTIQLLQAISKIGDTPEWHIHKAALDIFSIQDGPLGGNHILSLQHLICAFDDPSGKELADVFSRPWLISGIEECISECKLAIMTHISNDLPWFHLLDEFHTFCAIVKDSQFCYPRMCGETKAQLKELPEKDELMVIERIYASAVPGEEYEAGSPLGVGSETIKDGIEGWCIDRFIARGTISTLSQRTVDALIYVWQNTTEDSKIDSERRSLAFLASRVAGSDQELLCVCLEQITRFSDDFVSRAVALFRSYHVEDENSGALQPGTPTQGESCIGLTHLLMITKEAEAVQCWRRMLYKMVEALPHEKLLDVSLEKLSAVGWAKFMLDLDTLCGDLVSPESLAHSTFRASWVRQIVELVPTLMRLETVVHDRTSVKAILRGDEGIQGNHTLDILTNLTWAINAPAERLMQHIVGLMPRKDKDLAHIAVCLESLMSVTPEGLDACEHIWDASCKNSGTQEGPAADRLSMAPSTTSFDTAVTHLSEKQLPNKPLPMPGLDFSANDEDTVVMEVTVAGWLQDDDMIDNDKAAIEALANLLGLVCYRSRIPERKLIIARRFWEEEEAKMFEELARLNGLSRALKKEDPIGTTDLLATLGIPDISLLDLELAELPVEIAGAIEKQSENEIEISFNLSSYTSLQRTGFGIGDAKTLSVRLFVDYTHQAPLAFCVHLDTDEEFQSQSEDHTPWVSIINPKEPIGSYCIGSVNPLTWQLSRILHRTLPANGPNLAILYKTLEYHLENLTKLCIVCGEATHAENIRLRRSQPCNSKACANIWRVAPIDVRIPELHHDIFAADLILTCVYAAAQTGNLKLLPGCPITNTETIKFILNQLPPLSHFSKRLDMSDVLAVYHKDTAKLLIWAFGRFSGFIASAQGFLKVPSMPTGTHQFVLASGSPKQEAAFAARRASPMTSLINPEIDLLWHGTALDRLPCILNEGLRVLSGTELQRVGAAYGKGIYLAENPSLSLSYAPTAISWRNSGLNGMKLVLGCEVLANVGTVSSGIRLLTDERNVMVRYLFLLPKDANAPVANHVMPAMKSALSALRSGAV